MRRSPEQAVKDAITKALKVQGEGNIEDAVETIRNALDKNTNIAKISRKREMGGSTVRPPIKSTPPSFKLEY